jgi:hypothetical protein
MMILSVTEIFAMQGQNKSLAAIVKEHGQEIQTHDRPGQNQEGLDRQEILVELKHLTSSRHNQVIAAWLYLKLSNNVPALSKLEHALHAWGLEDYLVPRTQKLLEVIKVLSYDVPFQKRLYAMVFKRLSSDDRIVPGRGNQQIALRPPERLVVQKAKD